MDRRKPPRRWIWYFTLVSALIIVYKLCDNIGSVVSAVGVFIGILTPFVIGLMLALLLHRPSNWLETRIARGKARFWKIIARPVALTVVYLALLGVIALMVSLVLPRLAISLTELTRNLPTYVNSTVAKLESAAQSGFVQSLGIADYVNDIYKSVSDTVLQLLSTKNVINALRSVLSATMSIVDIVIGIIVSVYILSGREHLVRATKSIAGLVIPAEQVSRIGHYARESKNLFCNYFYGAFLDALVVGIIAAIGLSVFGIPYAVLLGLTLGLLNMIPYFGSIIGAVIISIIALLTNGIYAAIGVAIYIIVIQQIDGNIIQPRVVGDSVGLRPIYVLLAITVFGGLFGFWGIFLGVPVMAIIQLLVKDAIDGKIGRKATKTQTK